MRVGRGADTPHHKVHLVTKCYTSPRNWTDSLERLRQREMDVRFGAWNVRIDGRTISEWILR